MQKIICLIVLFVGISVSAQEIQLSWQQDINTAKEMAKSENKLVLIYFTKSDCQLCQQFYSDFFKQEKFKKLSNNFVFLMLDGSNQDNKTTDLDVIKERRLAMKYNKESKFPAVLIVDTEGKEKGDIMNSTSSEAINDYWNFLETLK